MKRFDSFTKFADEVQLLTCIESIQAYELECASVMGAFLPSQLEYLEHFCRKNSDFHIVSCFSSGHFNKAIKGAYAYFLASGNDDPKIYLIGIYEKYNLLP